MRRIGAGLGWRGQRNLEGLGPAAEDAAKGGDIILGIVNQVAAVAEVDRIRIALAEAVTWPPRSRARRLRCG